MEAVTPTVPGAEGPSPPVFGKSHSSEGIRKPSRRLTGSWPGMGDIADARNALILLVLVSGPSAQPG